MLNVKKTYISTEKVKKPQMNKEGVPVWRTMHVKAPGIIRETLNLSKQSCENISTSKSYLKREKVKA